MLCFSKKELQLNDVHLVHLSRRRTIQTVYGYMQQESQKVTLDKIIPSSLVPIILMFYFENVFDEYIYKVLKQVHPDLGITVASIEELNLFCYDMMDILSIQASKLATDSKVTIQHLKTAIQKIMGKELRKYTISEGDRYVKEFIAKNALKTIIPKDFEVVAVNNETEDDIDLLFTTSEQESQESEKDSHIDYNAIQKRNHKRQLTDDDDSDELGYIEKHMSYQKISINYTTQPVDLVFPYQPIEKYLNSRKIFLDDIHVAVFFTTVIEYLTVEILELSGNVANHSYHSQMDGIESIHIQTAIKSDSELFQLCFSTKNNLYCSWMEYDINDNDEEEVDDNVSLQLLLIYYFPYFDISNEEKRLNDQNKNLQQQEISWSFNDNNQEENTLNDSIANTHKSIFGDFKWNFEINENDKYKEKTKEKELNMDKKPLIICNHGNKSNFLMFPLFSISV